MSERPFLQVIKGDATPEEIAAIIAVIASAPSAAPAEPEKPRSAWTDRSRLHRRPLHPGPGAWRYGGF
jgi:hypothetical protein